MKRLPAKGAKIVVVEGDGIRQRVVVGITHYYITHRGYGTDLRRTPRAVTLTSIDGEGVLWARGWETRAAKALEALAVLDACVES